LIGTNHSIWDDGTLYGPIHDKESPFVRKVAKM
jgi:hypothetical protein